MYRSFVRRQVRTAFAELSQGNWPALLSRMAPDVRHSFPGTSALGGRRHGVDAVSSWADRLQRLLPGLTFEIRTLAVDGGPFDTRVGIEWTSSAPLPDGGRYENDGAHVLRMSRGRITSFSAYLADTGTLERALERVARAGVVEATLAPLP